MPPTTLTILPVSGLDLSLTVVILAGVGVLLYLSEALGWVFGGLIIPGYLGSILAISPAAGFTISVEALITLALARLISDGLGRLGAWTPFFGRDRFLLVVLLSVIVRQQAETWVLPRALASAARWYGQTLLPADEVHSIGLVLVPLIANALWKTSVRSGLLQVALPTAIAFILLDRVFLRSTNLSLGWMALAYEDPSLDFLGSARAYVVLLTGAIFASRFMLKVGWNSGGILIPALLGLAFLEPERLMATVLETLVLVAGYRGLVTLPGIRGLNLEGGRRLAILFSLAVLLRVGLSWARAADAPLPVGLGAGFGYLLSSLMAAKILQFQSIGVVLLPALSTAALGFGLGTGAVWTIEQTLPPTPPPADLGGTPPSTRLLESPSGALVWAQVRARLDLARAPSVSRPAGERVAWRGLLQAVKEGLARHDLEGVEAALPPGMSLRPGPELAGEPTWILAETDERLDALIGWGALLIRPGGSGPALGVEHPWAAGAAITGLAERCASLDCQMIAVSGVDAARPFEGWLVLAEVFADLDVQSGLSPSAEVPFTPEAPLSGLGSWLDAEVARATSSWSPSPAEALALSERVLPALVAAASNPAVEAEAARQAAMLGMRVLRIDDALVLAPIDAGPVVVVATGKHRPVIVEVPNPAEETGTLRIGLALSRALDATALVVDPSQGAAPGGGRSSSFYAAHLAVRPLITGQTGALTLTVRGLGLATGAALPEDLVVGVGVPVTVDAPPTVAALFAAGGPLGDRWSLRWARSGPDELGLTGAQLPTVQTDRVLGGVEPAVLWFSARARQSWTSPSRAEQVIWLAGAGLEIEDGDAAAPTGARLDPAAPSGGLAALEDLLERARAQRNVNLLRAAADLAERTPGAELRARWDDHRGYAFLELSLKVEGVTERLRLPLVEGSLLKVQVDFSRAAALESALAAGPVALHGSAR